MRPEGARETCLVSVALASPAPAGADGVGDRRSGGFTAGYPLFDPGRVSTLTAPLSFNRTLDNQLFIRGEKHLFCIAEWAFPFEFIEIGRRQV